MTGSLLVICAPSGTGKTSLVRTLCAQDSRLEVAISHTTRAMRSGEQHGVDYYFVSESEFANIQNSNGFVESAHVYGHNYATSKNELHSKLQQSKDLILEIDLQGAQQVAEKIPHAVIIGIVPPSITELEQRLQSRAKDSADVIQKRMAQARHEICQQTRQRIDYVVVNENFDHSLQQLKILIAASRLRACVNAATYKKILAD